MEAAPDFLFPGKRGLKFSNREDTQMAKASGESMKTVRTAPKAAPSRQINHQPLPSGPKLEPNAMGAPKIAADLKPSSKPKSGSIDPRQMRRY
jgi:hypothetical protein